MPLTPIVCQNCGAKYKLPESFASDKAKCKACGAVIDVAAQRAPTTRESAPSSAKPAAARPATAKPATPLAAPARPSTESPKPARGRTRAGTAAGAAAADSPARPARASRRGRRGATDDATAEGDDMPRGRRSRGARGDAEPRRKGGNMGVIIASTVGLAVIAIVLVFLLSDKDEGESDATKTAAAEDATTEQGAEPAGAGENQGENQTEPADGATATDTEGADAEEGDGTAQPAEASATEPAEPADATAGEARTAPPATEPAAAPGEEAMFDPKTETQPVEWPEDVSAEQRAEIERLVGVVMDGSGASARAKNQLAEIGYYALYGIVNQLREIDYTNSFQSMTAFELNQVIERITGGTNANYRAPQLGEEQAPEDVNWNAKTVRAWVQMLEELVPTKDKFDAYLERKKQAAAEAEEK